MLYFPGHEAERADQAGSVVGEEVTVQVRGDDDVVRLGIDEELVEHRVDDLLVDLDGLELGVGEGLARDGAEQAVGLGQDVGLVGDGDGGAGVGAGDARLADFLAAQGDLAGHGGDAVGGALGDALDGLADAAVLVVLLLLLDVQVLGVLAHDDHVDHGLGLELEHTALDRPHVGVQVELLAQRHDGRAVALDCVRRRADGAEQRAVALLLQRLDRLVGQRDALLLECLEAGLEVDEGELEPEGGGERLEDASSGGDDLLADAITGDEAWRELP